MPTGGLYGNSGTGALVATPGAESSGLYGNSTNFGGTYFEWFIFQVSETQPATPTGGSWSFSTNTGTAPSGWTSTPPANPTNTVWVSISIVTSRNTTSLTWSVPGKFSFSSGLPILSGSGAPLSGDGQSDQLYIQLDTTPQTIWFKETGTWTRLTGSTLYADLTSNQTIAGTKTFSSQIQGSISGNAANVTGTVAIANGGTGSTTAGTARAALGAAASGANSDITSLTGLTTALSLAQGGTGATTAADARTNLGLGSAAVLTAGAANGVATLDAGGTVPLSQIPASIQGGVSYQGTWNATTNTPTLTSSVGTKGYYYVVSVAGSTNLNGVTSWNIGDWAIFNGTAWEKIDNTDAVTSVNGYTGTVVLNANDVGALSNITSTDGSVTITTPSTGVRDLSVAVAAATNNVIAQVRNTTGATLTKGTAVYITGATGQLPTVSKALATSDATSAQTLGLMTADLANNSNGDVTIIGLISNINTSAYTDGEQLYLSPVTAGALTGTKPYAPNHLVYVAVVEHAHPTQGKLFVKVQNGYELDELHDVAAQSPTNGQTIVYNSTTNLWEKSFAPVISGTTINNTTIGATTASTGAFTTLTTSSTVTLNGGTANGVTYLNGSKVLTSGSALTFDGTNLSTTGRISTGAALAGLFNTATGAYLQWNYNGTANGYIGTANQAISGGATTDFGISSAGASSSLVFAQNTTEGMRLTSTGLGIGTSSPTAKLDVRGGVYLQDSNNNGAISATSSSGGQLYINTYSNQIWQIQGSEKMRLDSSGNLGIGTSSPSELLTVGAGTASVNSVLYLNGGSDSTKGAGVKLAKAGTAFGFIGAASWMEGATSNDLAFSANSAATIGMRLTSSGNLGLGVTPSAWTTLKPMQFAGGASLAGYSNTGYLGANCYFDGSWRYIASATSGRYEVAADHKWFTAPSGTAGNAISFTQAMTLDASGRLGIGSTSPLRPLDIAAAVSVDTTGAANKWTASFRDTTATAATGVGGGLLFQGLKSTGGAVGNFGAIAGLKENSTNGNENGYLGFFTVPDATGLITERARIDSSGNLLVGTTSGTAKVNFTAATQTNLSLTTTGVAWGIVSNQTNAGTQYFQRFDYSGTQIGSITGNNTTTAYTTSSDYRLKNSIAPMTGALAKVALLKPVTYKWNADGSDGEGFIAHELAEVCPQAVTGEKDAVDADGKPQYQGIDVSFLVGTLTAAIQELKAEFDAYKASHP